MESVINENLQNELFPVHKLAKSISLSEANHGTRVKAAAIPCQFVPPLVSCIPLRLRYRSRLRRYHGPAPASVSPAKHAVPRQGSAFFQASPTTTQTATGSRARK